MAMADLTINYQREMVVDFTMPFLELGKSWKNTNYSRSMIGKMELQRREKKHMEWLLWQFCTEKWGLLDGR